jgi:rare lipoprotein A
MARDGSFHGFTRDVSRLSKTSIASVFPGVRGRTIAVGAACALLGACSAHDSRQAATPGQAALAAASPVALTTEARVSGPESPASTVPLPTPKGAAAVGGAAKPAATTSTAASAQSARGAGLGSGLASWYGAAFHGRRTANGEAFDMHAFTAAHPKVPLPSYVRVTNVSNGRSIVVRVNDRGPYHRGRVIDVSKRTAEVLGFTGTGVGNVKMDYVGRAPAGGSDDRRLLASYQEFGHPARPAGERIAALAPVPDAALAAEAGGGAGPVAPILVASAPPVRSAPLSRAAPGLADPAPLAVAYVAPQPLIATPGAAAARAVTRAATAPRPAPAKRVIEPSEPVLASAAPALPTSSTASVGPTPVRADVSQRIAASFEGFGDPSAVNTLEAFR